MFSYNNSSLHSNNFSEPVPLPHGQSFLNHATPNFSPNHNPNSNISNSRHVPPQDIHYLSPFFNPFEDYGDLLLQQHHHVDATLKSTLLEDPHHQGSTTSTAPSTKMVDWDSNKNNGGSQLQQQQIQVATVVRRRSCKKDRHSKIITARGMRDRRMRLSLDVAQKFFGLQDVLGFDKASKTVQWLLTQAASEIDKLTSTTSTSTAAAAPGETAVRSASSISECEVVSGGTDHVTAATGDVIDDERSIQKKPSDRIKKTKTTTRTTSVVVRRAFQKESRESARARARERTLEKMWRRHQYCNNNTVDQTWSTFETTGEESGGTQSSNNMKDHQQHQPTTISSNLFFQATAGDISSNINYTNPQDQLQVEIDDDSNSVMGKYLCPSSILNYLQSTTTGSTSLEQHQLFADFQFSDSWSHGRSTTTAVLDHSLF